MVRKKYNEDELIVNIRKKYGDALNNIYGCQWILLKILKENNGHIVANRTFDIIDELCQNMILKAEELGFPETEKYRRRQTRIENLVDKLNQPDVSTDITERKGRINIIIKNRYYEKKPKKCHLDVRAYESEAGLLGDD